MKYLFFLVISISINTCFGQSTTKMILIPGGEYLMGKDSEKGYDFSPAHRVSIDSFLIDKHEVTNKEYLVFCKATDHKLPEFWGEEIFRSGEQYPNHPVIGITWNDARDYANWIGKRLPKEAEWEFAARGGLLNKEFPNGDEWTKERKRNEEGEWKNLIDPVGKYDSNDYGLYDMGGNVWEWVFDRYNYMYYKSSESNNPQGPEKGSFRVVRSGSWHSGAMCKKVYYRKGLPASWVDFAVGFRCAMDVPKN